MKLSPKAKQSLDKVIKQFEEGDLSSITKAKKVLYPKSLVATYSVSDFPARTLQASHAFYAKQPVILEDLKAIIGQKHGVSPKTVKLLEANFDFI